MLKNFKDVIKKNYLIILGLAVALSLIFYTNTQLQKERSRDRALLDFESERRAIVLGRSMAIALLEDLTDSEAVSEILYRFSEKIIEIQEVDVLIPLEDKFHVLASSEKGRVGTIAANDIQRRVYSSGKEYAEWVAIEVKRGLNQPILETRNLLELTLPIHNESKKVVGLLFISYSTKASENLFMANQRESFNTFLATAAFVFLFMFSFASVASRNYREVMHLQESVKSRDELLSMAAHELGTPLAHVKGSLSVLIKDIGKKIGDVNLTLLQRSFDSTQRLINLVEDILTVSRFERGKIQIFPRPIHLEEVLQTTFKNYQSLAEQKGLKACYKKPKEALPKVVVDPDKLSEIISNLLSNAVKYTQKGNITLKAYKQNKAVVIEISDTGVGIDEDDIVKLFNRFSRIKRTAGLVKGSGLGLYITKLLIEAHGGKIEAESGINKGTTFKVVFPV